MLNTKVEPMPTTLGDEEGDRRRTKAKTEKRLSLDAMFEKCTSNATELAKNLPKAVASELNNTIIRRIEDIHFRLQIWGSEVGANARRQLTFDDILKLKDSVLPEIVQRILESFQQQFSTIGGIFEEFLSDSGKRLWPRKTSGDHFQELRAPIDVVYGLVQELVGLSNSIRMEQALQKNEGPYDDMRKEIQRTKDSFQDCTFPSNAKEELQPKNPVKESPDAWAKGYMLTLDDGGVRVISSVLILKAILHAVAEQELAIDSEATSSYSPLANSDDSQQPMEDELSDWLPCHYFDYIAGTSSGGLVAIMLGRLRMSVTDCFREMVSISTKTFGNSHWMDALAITKYIIPKYSHKDLENAMKDLIRRKYLPANSGQQMESEVAYASDPQMCRTIVLAYRQIKSRGGLSGLPYLFRTYDHPRDLSKGNEQFAKLVRNPGPAANVAIWQAARATSATPLYFPKMRIGENTFLDGGVWSNNPTMETVIESLSLSGEVKEANGLVLSIGTGSRPLPVSTKIGPAFIRSFRRSVNETGRTEEVMEFWASKLFTYKRFNVQKGLGDIKLDEWKTKKNRNITLDQIDAATTDYLQQPSIQAELKETAKILVENRRKRSQTPRWRSFCLGEEGQK